MTKIVHVHEYAQWQMTTIVHAHEYAQWQMTTIVHAHENAQWQMTTIVYARIYDVGQKACFAICCNSEDVRNSCGAYLPLPHSIEL
jgi:hypothetical protein